MATQQNPDSVSTSPATTPVVGDATPRPDEHVVALVYSGSGLQGITGLINSYDPNAVEGPDGSLVGNAVVTIRVDFRPATYDGQKIYQETNRTIVTMPRSVLNALLEAGFGERNRYDFVVTEYDIRTGNLPPPDCKYALFFPMPRVVSLDDTNTREWIHMQMSAKMQQMERLGFTSKGNYKIHMPCISRVENRYANQIIVTFAKVPPVGPNGEITGHHEDLGRIKLVLDMTMWYGLPHPDFKCKEDHFTSYETCEKWHTHVAWCREDVLARLNAAYSTGRRSRRSPSSGGRRRGGTPNRRNGRGTPDRRGRGKPRGNSRDTRRRGKSPKALPMPGGTAKPATTRVVNKLPVAPSKPAWQGKIPGSILGKKESPKIIMTLPGGSPPKELPLPTVAATLPGTTAPVLPGTTAPITTVAGSPGAVPTVTTGPPKSPLRAPVLVTATPPASGSVPIVLRPAVGTPTKQTIPM